MNRFCNIFCDEKYRFELFSHVETFSKMTMTCSKGDLLFFFIETVSLLTLFHKQSIKTFSFYSLQTIRIKVNAKRVKGAVYTRDLQVQF